MIRGHCLTNGDIEVPGSSIIDDNYDRNLVTYEGKYTSLCGKPDKHGRLVMTSDLEDGLKPRGICAKCWKVFKNSI